jgi:hypothetical protein
MNTNPKVKLVNSTNADLRDFGMEAAILAAIDGDGTLPEELADIFNLEIITRPDGSRYGRITWA